MDLTRFGRSFGGHTGIMDLMDDMGRALAADRPVHMLGGGNPARIPAMETVWRRRMEEILARPGEYENMVGNYDRPQGRERFGEALARYLRDRYGWNLGPENIAVTNGSQTAMFLLINMFSEEGRRILLPILPEYIGYADQGIADESFVACRPRIEQIDAHNFKYRLDLEAVEAALVAAETGEAEPIGAILISRPTNPSGNVVTDAELYRLDALAERFSVPLIVDNAYGVPFPHIIFDEIVEGEVRPLWNDRIILGMSLSKIGLPGVRTGIVIASPEIITALSRANAILSLANGTVGQFLVEPLLRDGTIGRLAEETITPFYRERAAFARETMETAFGDAVPWAIHRLEGSIFLWLWLPDLPVPTKELYRRLKERGVIVVPGEYFFFGDTGDWAHSRQCLRINYGREPESITAGFTIIAEEVRALWRR